MLALAPRENVMLRLMAREPLIPVGQCSCGGGVQGNHASGACFSLGRADRQDTIQEVYLLPTELANLIMVVFRAITVAV